jgi:hypothetical protein
MAGANIEDIRPGRVPLSPDKTWQALPGEGVLLLARLWRGAPGLRGGVHERGPVDRTAVNHRGSEYAWIFEAATSREELDQRKADPTAALAAMAGDIEQVELPLQLAQRD